MEKTIQRYPNGSTVLCNGHEWTVVSMRRDSDALLQGQTDRGEGYNLYRLTRPQENPLLVWQHELDAENAI